MAMAQHSKVGRHYLLYVNIVNKIVNTIYFVDII